METRHSEPHRIFADKRDDNNMAEEKEKKQYGSGEYDESLMEFGHPTRATPLPSTPGFITMGTNHDQYTHVRIR